MNKKELDTERKRDRPTIYIYNDVFDAWVKSRSPKAVVKVLDLLSKLETGKDGSLVHPDEITYSIANGVLAPPVN